jgi:hypothetical protein
VPSVLPVRALCVACARAELKREYGAALGDASPLEAFKGLVSPKAAAVATGGGASVGVGTIIATMTTTTSTTTSTTAKATSGRLALVKNALKASADDDATEQDDKAASRTVTPVLTRKASALAPTASAPSAANAVAVATTAVSTTSTTSDAPRRQSSTHSASSGAGDVSRVDGTRDSSDLLRADSAKSAATSSPRKQSASTLPTPAAAKSHFVALAAAANRPLVNKAASVGRASATNPVCLL